MTLISERVSIDSGGRECKLSGLSVLNAIDLGSIDKVARRQPARLKGPVFDRYLPTSHTTHLKLAGEAVTRLR